MPAINKPNQHFDTTLYTGNGTAQSITNAGGFQPDMVWFKQRTGSSSNIIQDSIRGVTKVLVPSSTTGDQTISTYITAFNSNGFSVGNGSGADINDVNTNTYTYVGWQWKAGGTAVSNTSGTITSSVSANPTAGFSVVTYTHNGTNAATVGHGLGVTPSFIINKQRSAIANWRCYHASLTAGYNIQLNLTSAQGTAADIFQTAPTSSVFTPGNGDSASGQTFVSYCFAPIAGYSAFGSYTGNGSTDGPFIYTGFRPRMLIIKRSGDGTNDWAILDTAREPNNMGIAGLKPNSSSAEYSGYNYRDMLSNGFKLRNGDSDVNNSGSTYIYAAFAEAPFKYSNGR